MSPYIVVYLLLFFPVFFSLLINKQIYVLTINGRKKLDSVAYKVAFWIIGFMLAFRYGQGTDYFAYYDTFKWMRSDLVFNFTSHTEVGWNLFNFLIKIAGLPFEVLVFIVSVVEMICIKKFIERYCKSYNALALSLLYPAVILFYLFSALRQGLVISVFLGFMLQYLESMEYRKYICITLLMSTIHIVSIAYLILVPVMKREKFINLQRLEIIKIFSALLSLSFGIFNVGNILKVFLLITCYNLVMLDISTGEQTEALYKFIAK